LLNTIACADDKAVHDYASLQGAFCTRKPCDHGAAWACIVPGLVDRVSGLPAGLGELRCLHILQGEAVQPCQARHVGQLHTAQHHRNKTTYFQQGVDLAIQATQRLSLSGFHYTQCEATMGWPLHDGYPDLFGLVPSCCKSTTQRSSASRSPIRKRLRRHVTACAYRRCHEARCIKLQMLQPSQCTNTRQLPRATTATAAACCCCWCQSVMLACRRATGCWCCCGRCGGRWGIPAACNCCRPDACT
jgi:hypothetical protein